MVEQNTFLVFWQMANLVASGKFSVWGQGQGGAYCSIWGEIRGKWREIHGKWHEIPGKCNQYPGNPGTFF